MSATFVASTVHCIIFISYCYGTSIFLCIFMYGEDADVDIYYIKSADVPHI